MQDGRGARDARAEEPFDAPTENDPTESVSQGEPYFPPTDPVTREGPRGTRIAGGFGEGEIREEHPHAATEVGPSDEALADAIRSELALDASTADLRISVTVEDGVARIRGEVPDLADADNALSVAGRVPGVADVVDELSVAS